MTSSAYAAETAEGGFGATSSASAEGGYGATASASAEGGYGATAPELVSESSTSGYGVTGVR